MPSSADSSRMHSSAMFLLLTTLLLLPQASESHAIGWSLETDYASPKAKELRKTWIVQVLALVFSGLSVASSIVTFFWFIRMQKRFRHRLIMLLIFGDVMRATWFFMYAANALAQGQVGTQSSFCQSSGFFIQYGTETTDYAVLVIAIHSALQVFRPSTNASSDGLFRYRIAVYIGAFFVPALMAGLAFINPTFGYLTVGAFCVLPLRPFWYRLALAWVPRYLVISIIMSLAVAIYAYVGFEFHKYSQHGASLNDSSLSTPGNSTMYSTKDDIPVLAVPEGTEFLHQTSRKASLAVQDAVLTPRRASAVSFAGVGSISDSIHANPLGLGIYSENSNQLKHSENSRIGAHSSADIEHTATSTMVDENLQSSQKAAIHGKVSGKISEQRQLERQRARIHRQLRLMFIYPITYTLMWLFPFVQHCTSYKNKYVVHPIWWLRVVTVICMTGMGFVNCVIFSLREKPWRSISTSDGGLWGSFVVFNGTGSTRQRQRQQQQLHQSHHESATASGRNMMMMSKASSITGVRTSMQQSVADGVSRMKSSVRRSFHSNDQSQIAISEARARLELEKEDRLAAARARIVSYTRGDDDDDDDDCDDGDDDGDRPAAIVGEIDEYTPSADPQCSGNEHVTRELSHAENENRENKSKDIDG